MPIDKSKLTKEMIKIAAKCQTADELVALAKRSEIEITKDEAEAYMDELQNYELKDGELKHIAGGKAPGGGDKSIPPESRY